MLEYFCKNSREALDYTIDFNRFLIGRESITGASAVISAPKVTDAGKTLAISRVNHTKNQAIVWLIAGEENIEYTVVVSIDTDQGRRRDHRFMVRTLGNAIPVVSVNLGDTDVTIQTPPMPVGLRVDSTDVTVNYLP